MYSPLWEFTLQFSSKLSRPLLKQHRDKVSTTALKGSGKTQIFFKVRENLGNFESSHKNSKFYLEVSEK